MGGHGLVYGVGFYAFLVQLWPVVCRGVGFRCLANGRLPNARLLFLWLIVFCDVGFRRFFCTKKGGGGCFCILEGVPAKPSASIFKVLRSHNMGCLISKKLGGGL